MRPECSPPHSALQAGTCCQGPVQSSRLPPREQAGVLQGPIAVLGPGTGLGCANLFWDDNEGATSGYRVFPSEGSHAGFAPRGWRQRALQAFVEQELGRCGVEQASAAGLWLHALWAGCWGLLLGGPCFLVVWVECGADLDFGKALA